MYTYYKWCFRVAVAISSSLGAANGMEDANIPQEWYPIPKGAVFKTGDTWSYETVNYRLYGVQSCLRDTTFKNDRGSSQDCGEASIAVLIALIRDFRPSCYTVAEDVPQRTRFVICVATIQKGPAAGSRLDLGTALIIQGFGFASRRADGSIVQPVYGVAERQAQSRRAGLWAFSDFPNPTEIIGRALRGNAVPGIREGMVK